jgi:hypothetical protein
MRREMEERRGFVASSTVLGGNTLVVSFDFVF